MVVPSTEFGEFCSQMDKLIIANDPDLSDTFFDIFQDNLHDIDQKYHEEAITYFNQKN